MQISQHTCVGINWASQKIPLTVNVTPYSQILKDILCFWTRNCSNGIWNKSYCQWKSTSLKSHAKRHYYILCDFKGPPKVSISQLPEPLINECVQIRATIRSFPKYTGVIWKKDEEIINTKSPKYEGSKNDDKYSVLSIQYVNREDEKVYTVEITNGFGTTKCSSDRLKVIGGKSKVIILFWKVSIWILFSSLRLKI